MEVKHIAEHFAQMLENSSIKMKSQGNLATGREILKYCKSVKVKENSR